MKCIHCEKEIKYNEEYERFGYDGDVIHKKCKQGMDKWMDNLSNMNDIQFNSYMQCSNK